MFEICYINYTQSQIPVEDEDSTGNVYHNLIDKCFMLIL